MFHKIFMFLTGFVFTVVGFTFIITYLNLTTMGYSFFDYFKFICSRLECLISVVGIIFILISLYRKEDKYGIHI